MSKITLEDVAEFLADERSHQYWTEAAVLVRAAQQVVEEARRHSCEQHLYGTTTMCCGMCAVLAAFDKAGEQ